MEQPIFSIDKRQNPNYPFETEQVPVPSNKKRIFLILILLFLIIAGGFVGVLALRIWDPLWNPFRPSPEAVLIKAWQVQKELKTGHIKFQGFAKGEGKIYDLNERPSTFEISADINIDQDFDRTQKEMPKSKADFSYSIYVGPIGFPISGKIITIGQDYYLKLESLPFLGLINFFSQNFPFEDKTEQEMINQFFSKISDLILNRWIRVSLEEIEKEWGITYKKPSLQEKEKFEKKLDELILKYPPLGSKKEFNDEIVNGKASYHYLLELKKENLKKFFNELVKFIKEENISFGTGFDSAFFEVLSEEDISQAIDEFFSQIKSSEIEIWIDKKTYFVYRIKINFVAAVEEEEEELGKLNFGGEMIFSNHNQPVEIQAPEESVGLPQLFKELIPFIQEFFQAGSKNKDAIIMEVLSQVSIVATQIYLDEGGYTNLCRNGDLNISHPRVGGVLNVVRNDIINQGSKVTCYSSKTRFCAKAPLISEQGKYYCVDSDGRKRKVSEQVCTPTNLTCISK